MTSSLTAYVALACTSGVLNVYLGLYVLTRRHLYKNIAGFFIVYALSTAIYCFGAAFGMVATSLDVIKAWTVVQYVGMPFSPALGLLFVMKYLGRKVTKRMVVSLLLIPAATFVVVAAEPLRHLHYRVFEIDPILGTPYTHLEIGPWYIIHGVFIFSCMFTAFFLIIGQWRETARIYRPQLVALMWGQLVPMLTAFLYLTGATPAGVDPVPVVLWLTTLLYLLSTNTSNMFRILPVAKDAIFHSIDDGVIVLDEAGRLVEFNDACKRMFPMLDVSAYGEKLDRVWERISGTSFPFREECGVHVWEVPGSAAVLAGSVYQLRITRMNPVRGAKGLLIIFTDITELKRLQETLEERAYKDELTRVCNRRAFFEMGDVQFSEALEEKIPFSAVLFDIDYFKNVNDTYGHQAGDDVLVHVAAVCENELGTDVLFARYGGEEFVMALKGKVLSEAKDIAEQVRRAVEAKPLTTNGQVIPITISGGVAGLSGAEDDSLSLLLNRADEALYEAKRAGRNRICASEI